MSATIAGEYTRFSRWWASCELTGNQVVACVVLMGLVLTDCFCLQVPCRSLSIDRGRETVMQNDKTNSKVAHSRSHTSPLPLALVNHQLTAGPKRLGAWGQDRLQLT